MKKNRTNQAFSLVEMIVVLGILAILIALSVFSSTSLKAESRNTKRVNDIKQIQFALDMYRRESGHYPNELNFGEEFKNEETGTIFIKKLPNNPRPRNDGDCPDQDYQYTYNSSNDTYALSFCISDSVGNLEAGSYQANHSGIIKL